MTTHDPDAPTHVRINHRWNFVTASVEENRVTTVTISPIAPTDVPALMAELAALNRWAKKSGVQI